MKCVRVCVCVLLGCHSAIGTQQETTDSTFAASRLVVIHEISRCFSSFLFWRSTVSIAYRIVCVCVDV